MPQNKHSPYRKLVLKEKTHIRRTRTSECFRLTVNFYVNWLSPLYLSIRKLKIMKIRLLSNKIL